MAMMMMMMKRRKNMPPVDIPEFGAIFMANRATMEECLEKQLFGFPSSNGDFVRRVRAGMILFLFEYEERRLHGVFQAATDGAMNIVPNAYSSSGKRFPAQVRFSRVWECEPLCEAEFRDAIWENYYERNKFLFGLSQDQVSRLLKLFNCKRMEVKTYQNLSCGTKLIWNYGGGDREMETEGSIFRRKLSSGISVVSCRKLKSTPSDHTGNYEPPGSGSSGVSGVSISSCELESEPPQVEDEPIKVEVEPENSKESPKVSTADLGDFIPLPSPDHSDCEVEPFGPHLPLKLLSGASPLPSTDDCLSKEGTQNSLQVANNKKSNVSDNNGNPYPAKRLYSDVKGEKSSVFSRLNFGLKNNERGKGVSSGKKTTGHDSVQDVVGTFLQRHGSWSKSNAKSNCFGRGDSTPTVKRSVFSRLSRGSGSVGQNNVTILLQNDERNERVRRDRFSFQEGEGSYKWSRTMKQFPEAPEQIGYWKKARDREVSNQKLDDEEYIEMSKTLKRRIQTEEGIGVGSENNFRFEPPRRKLVRPMFEMQSEIKTFTSASNVNQMTFEESSANKENNRNCEAPIKSNTADEKINMTVEKEMQPEAVQDPWKCKGGSREAESNIIDEVSKSTELLVGGFNARGSTVTTPLKVYSRRAKKVEVYPVCAV